MSSDSFNLSFDSTGVKLFEGEEKFFIAILIQYNKEKQIIDSLSYVTALARTDEEAEEKFGDFKVENEEFSYHIRGIKRVSDIINEATFNEL